MINQRLDYGFQAERRPAIVEMMIMQAPDWFYILQNGASSHQFNSYASVQHTNFASDNGLSPVQTKAIIWTNAAILSIRPRETYFNGILFEIQKF